MKSLSNFFLSYFLLAIIAIAILSLIEEIYYYRAFGVDIINLVGVESLVFSGRGISRSESTLTVLLCPTLICIFLILHEWLEDSLEPNCYRRWVFFIISLTLLLLTIIIPVRSLSVAFTIFVIYTILLLVAYVTIFHLRLYIVEVLGFQAFFIYFLTLSMVGRWK